MAWVDGLPVATATVFVFVVIEVRGRNFLSEVLQLFCQPAPHVGYPPTHESYTKIYSEVMIKGGQAAATTKKRVAAARVVRLAKYGRPQGVSALFVFKKKNCHAEMIRRGRRSENAEEKEGNWRIALIFSAALPSLAIATRIDALVHVGDAASAPPRERREGEFQLEIQYCFFPAVPHVRFYMHASSFLLHLCLNVKIKHKFILLRPPRSMVSCSSYYHTTSTNSNTRGGGASALSLSTASFFQPNYTQARTRREEEL